MFGLQRMKRELDDTTDQLLTAYQREIDALQREIDALKDLVEVQTRQIMSFEKIVAIQEQQLALANIRIQLRDR